ncbi:MAG: DNA-directed RNA polymerase subunit omega [Desulfotomaculales bacterium]
MAISEPSLDELLDKAESRYALVVMAAKRARVLTERSNAGVIQENEKPVSMALRQIAQGKIRVKRLPPSGRK